MSHKAKNRKRNTQEGMPQTEFPIYLGKSGILFIFLPPGLCRKSLICIPLWQWHCVGLHPFRRSSLQGHILTLAVQSLLQFIPQGPLLLNTIYPSLFPFLSASLTHFLYFCILPKFLTQFFLSSTSQSRIWQCTGSTLRPMGECPLVSRGFGLPAKLPRPLVLSVVKLHRSIMLQKVSQQRSWVVPQAQSGRL